MADAAGTPPDDLAVRLAGLEREVAELRAGRSVAEALARVGSWRFELATGLVDGSAEARRIYGLDDGKWTITRVQAIPLPEYRPLLDRALRDLVEHGAPYDVEFRIQRPTDLAIRHIHSMARYDAGRFLVVGTLQDITEQRQAEEALKRERDRLAFVIAGSRLGTWAWSIPGNTAVFDESLGEICGYAPGELSLIGTDLWRHLVHPGDQAAATAELERCLADPDAVFEHEFRVRHKDGRWVWLLSRGRVMSRDGEGRPIEMFGTHIDITDRKHAEDELRRFKTMFDTANFGAAMTDPDGRLLYINERFAADHGYAPDELRGKEFVMLHPPEGLDAARGFLQQMRTGGTFGPVEVMRLHKDGSDFPMLMMGCAIRGADGGIESFVATALDIRGQKAIEAQLAQARKMESVGRLAGGVAHDFNNMLGVILGNAELALDRLGPGDPGREYLEEINAAARRSAGVAQQLLAFARKQTIAPKLLDLNDIVESSLTLLRRVIGENVVLSWRPGAALWRVLMDPSQVHQILMNLCVNAKDAIEGVGTVTIATRNVTADADFCATHPGFAEGDSVVLTVGDTGVGMDRTTLDHLFEPFFTTKEVDKGTGLGLATVYGIVTQNHGRIAVESQVGRGTEFRVWLPAHHVPGAGPEREACQARPKARPGETVLVVEDEPAILRLASMLLKTLGYTVLSAASPSEALAQADAYNGRIDLLLSDVVMPEMNGWELAEQLTPSRPGMKRLFMSGYTASAIEQYGVLAAGVAFIQKPFTTEGLAAKVRQTLDE